MKRIPVSRLRRDPYPLEMSVSRLQRRLPHIEDDLSRAASRGVVVTRYQTHVALFRTAATRDAARGLRQVRRRDAQRGLPALVREVETQRCSIAITGPDGAVLFVLSPWGG